MTEIKSHGQIVYEGYILLKSGVQTPWNQLHTHEKADWEIAAKTLREHITNKGVKPLVNELVEVQLGKIKLNVSYDEDETVHIVWYTRKTMGIVPEASNCFKLKEVK